MKNFLNGYTKFMDVLEKILRWILGISMAVMVAVIFYQVILRYVFHNSNIWSTLFCSAQRSLSAKDLICRSIS